MELERRMRLALPLLLAGLVVLAASPARAEGDDAAPSRVQVIRVADQVTDGGWTTPRRAFDTARQAAPRTQGPTSIARPAGSTAAARLAPPAPPAPAPVDAAEARLARVTATPWPQAEDGGDTIVIRTRAQDMASPPPPPPPAAAPAWSTPAPAAAPSAQPGQIWTPYSSVPPSARCWSGCRLPCEDGISQWHVRGLGGYVFYFGEDPASDCGYAGLDLGRTFCGCWGLDLFYRWNSGEFDRINDPRASKDGGHFHHVGIKVTWERSFGGSSRFYYRVGVGPEYFWTQDYLDDDDGFGVFGELVFGYVLSQNIRLFAGVNVHGLDTEVTREDPLDDGESRWLWLVAPVAGVEIDF